MRSMNQKEFDAIYPKKLKPLQHEVLDMWLQGESNKAIAKSLYVTESTVRHRISNICKLFGFKNKAGEHLRQSYKLKQLFALYKPKPVSDELKETCESYPDNPEQV